MTPDQFPRRRPSWWPENQPWPPTHRRFERGRFFRRVGCLFGVVGLLTVIGCATLFGLLFNVLGLNNLPEGSTAIVRGLIVIVIIGVVFSAIVAGRALRHATGPIADVMEAASKVADGNYAVRVAEHGPREVRDLARSFNTMTTRLQVNDEQRRAVMAEVAHELRTPLTIIQGQLEGMLDGIYTPDQARLESTLDETRVLARIIDDLRTLSLAESGRLKLEIEQTDLAELIKDTAASFQAQAVQAEIDLGVEITSDLPLVDIDPTRIREVIGNLIVNALRFTPPGGQIRVRAAPSADQIEVTISDTGRGIAPDDLPRIFDRFYKGSDSHGTGLGLTIAKNLVAAHGGSIRAHSELDHGTTITFTLPLKS